MSVLAAQKSEERGKERFGGQWTYDTKKTRERERERERQTDRQTDRETERQRHRETERQRDRETERQRDRERRGQEGCTVSWLETTSHKAVHIFWKVEGGVVYKSPDE